jgi:NADPH:quinone reductase-like Zn-dependent oxidoreductase
MKAIVQHSYGPPDILKLEEVEKPVPSDDEVLVQVHSACINWANNALVRGKPFMLRLNYGFFKPKFTIPGGDMAGIVEAVGSNVTQFQPGDEVYGDLVDWGFGAFAEYVCAPENALAPKPANLSFEEAAAVPQAALVALQGLRDKGHIQPGQKVLINGASSGNGTFAVQIAKSFGAEVTGVCSTRNLDLVRSIGADHVIDYTQEDFTQSGEQYDLILATAGYRTLSDYKRALSPKGIYVMAGGTMTQVFQALLFGWYYSEKGGRTLTNLSHKPSTDDLLFMKELIEAGKVKPVIDRRYPLAEIADAFRYYEKGRSRGKVVITVYSATD